MNTKFLLITVAAATIFIGGFVNAIYLTIHRIEDKPESISRFTSEYAVGELCVVKDNQTGLEYLVNNHGGIICLTPDAFTYQGVK